MTKIVKSHPKEEAAAASLFEMAQISEAQGRAKQAIDAYNTLAADHPQNLKCPLGLARVFVLESQAERLKEAVLAAEGIASMYHDRDVIAPEALEGLAITCIHRKEFDLAIRLYQAMPQISDNQTFWQPFADNFVAYCLREKGESEKAIEVYRQMIDKYSSSPEWQAGAQYKIGYTYLLQGKLQEASAEFQKVVDNYPNTSWKGGAAEYIQGIKKRLETGAEK